MTSLYLFQTLNFVVRIRGVYFTAFTVLMTNKDETLYREVFALLLAELHGVRFVYFKTDFEKVSSVILVLLRSICVNIVMILGTYERSSVCVWSHRFAVGHFRLLVSPLPGNLQVFRTLIN